MARRRRDRGEHGFTLIELLVTLSVTVIGLVGLMSLHVATSKGNTIASRSAEATSIAQQAVEELRALPVDDAPHSIVARYGALPIEDEGMDSVIGRAGITYKRYLTVRELLSLYTDIIHIRVEVVWTNDGSDPDVVPEDLHQRVSLELIRTRQEAL